MAVKKRKRRKPMSAEQRAAAAERLAKAREKRKKENPPQYKNVADSVLALPDDHDLSRKNVTKWIKHNRELLSEAKKMSRRKSDDKSEVSKYEGYIRNMERYLRDGDWVDDFYGENQEKRIRKRCIALAYEFQGPNKGRVKRDVGTFYPDIGCVWTRDIAIEEGYIVEKSEEKPKRTRRKRTK